MKAILLALAFVIAIGRIFIEPRLTSIPSIEGEYEAFSHLLVGFLILVPWYDRQQQLGPSKLYGYVGWSLAIWELGWFLVQKYA